MDDKLVSKCVDVILEKEKDSYDRTQRNLEVDGKGGKKNRVP